MNYPAMLIGACFLGGVGAAIGNAIKEQDVKKCALAGLATGVFCSTVVYLWFIITGSPFPH